MRVPSLRLWGWGVLLLALSLACSDITITIGDTTATLTPDLAATAAAIAAQTLQAAPPDTAGTVPGAPTSAVVTAQPPASTPIPSATPIPLPTATPIPPTPTFAPVLFTATANVRCRQGPGVFYPEVGIVAEGQTVPVLAGTDLIQGYWLVQLPDGRTCWAYERYATLQGNTSVLPLATPPPAPPAAFSLLYIDYSECGCRHGLTFEIVNRSEVAIESLYMEVRASSGTYPLTVDLHFSWWLDCDRKGSANTIFPGKSVWVTVPTDGVDLRGHDITVYAKACTADALHGDCFERTVPFRP